MFYKSLQNLSISIKDINVQVKNSPNKVLVNNKYQPLVISNLENKLYKPYAVPDSTQHKK